MKILSKSLIRKTKIYSQKDGLNKFIHEQVEKCVTDKILFAHLGCMKISNKNKRKFVTQKV